MKTQRGRLLHNSLVAKRGEHWQSEDPETKGNRQGRMHGAYLQQGIGREYRCSTPERGQEHDECKQWVHEKVS